MGIDVGLQLSEEHFADTGLYLFSSVLDRFLGLYSAINSFTKLTVSSKRGVWKSWPRRAGEKALL